MTRGVGNSQPRSFTLSRSKLAEFVIELRPAARSIFRDDAPNAAHTLAQLRVNGGINAVAHGEVGAAAKQRKGERKDQRVPKREADANGSRLHSSESRFTE